MIKIETNRLNISEFTLEDAPFILDITNSSGWLKYIGDRNIHTLDDARSYLKNDPLLSYQTHGFGLFKVSLKDSDQTIGMCGFKKRSELNFPDLGFAFLPAFEGKGFAFESCQTLLQWAASNLKSPKVLAITLKENQRSILLLVRLGFSQIHLSQNEQEALLTYEIKLAEN